MNEERLKKSIVINSVIILGLGICCLFFNIEVFSVTFKNSGIYIRGRPFFADTCIKYTALEINIFYVIIFVSYLDLLLIMIKKYSYFRYYFIGISSTITLFMSLLIFIYPELFILNRENYLFDLRYNTIIIAHFVVELFTHIHQALKYLRIKNFFFNFYKDLNSLILY